MSNWSKNLFVLLPVLFGISVAGFYLYQDFQPVDGEAESELVREQVGQMLTVENSVKRQLSDNVLWDPIASQTPVYARDSIRTGPESSATIRLDDNSLLDIGENSLIVLDRIQDKLAVDLKAGDLKAKNLGQGFMLKLKDNYVKGSGADLLARTGPDQNTSVSVQKGKAVLTDRNRKETELSEDELAGLGDDGIEEVSKIAVELRLPENKSQVQTNRPDFRQTFTWDVLKPGLTQEYFEISKTPAFKPEETKRWTAHQATTSPLMAGYNYWRVGWKVDGKMRFTEHRMVNLTGDKRLELTYPENASLFDFGPEDNQLELNWKSQIQAKAYVVEVAHGPDFKSLVFSKAQPDFKSLVKDLPSKTYYWRVRAFGESNEELATSATHSFTVRLLVAQLPELLRPDHEGHWESTEPVDFSWLKTDKAAEYRVTISRDSEQKQILKSTKLEATRLSWPMRGQSHIYWSVRALNANGQTVGQSEVRRLNYRPKAKGLGIALIYPKNKSEVIRESTEKIEPILFQWQILRRIPGPITLFVATDPEFKNLIYSQPGLTQLSQSVQLKTLGQYFWRLQSKSSNISVTQGPKTKDETENDDGRRPAAQEESEWSETFEFKLRASSSSQAPVLISPQDKSKIEREQDVQTTTAILTWKPGPAAPQANGKFHVILERFDAKLNQRITLVDRVVEQYELQTPELNDGTYLWTVGLIDEMGQEVATSKTYEFLVLPVELMEAPQLNAPVIK
ncbi:MAG: FecR domain-containing protein [Oligoflexia bacterium]|nr:FecR domain-containing protein [Oligoflexia bacterium]